MSEALAQGPASGFGGPVAADAPTAGAMLRQAREEAGLHVATLAGALKVPVRKLEALESDRYEELSDAVFVRALAASVCRNLKMDPAPVLQRLPATGGPRLAADEGGINAPFRSPRDGATPTLLDQLSKPVYLVVFALLLGALVLILLPSRRDDAPVASDAGAPPPELALQPPSSEPVADTPATPATAAAVQVAQVTPAALMPATSLGAAPALAPASSARIAAPLQTAAITPTAPAATAESGAPAVATPAGIVVFKASGESWIQVTDAKGAVPLRKLLAAGESAAASGALPLTVTVGSVSATDVQVRGKPFDMARVSRDNVARFEVK